MYEAGTILVRKEPLGEEGSPNPYDRVEVIGVSPVSHAFAAGSEWSGAGATGILIQPAGEAFGSTLDEPFGKLQQLYDVDFIPEREQVMEPQVRRYNATQPSPTRRTPEEVFAAEAATPDV